MRKCNDATGGGFRKRKKRRATSNKAGPWERKKKNYCTSQLGITPWVSIVFSASTVAIPLVWCLLSQRRQFRLPICCVSPPGPTSSSFSPRDEKRNQRKSLFSSCQRSPGCRRPNHKTVNRSQNSRERERSCTPGIFVCSHGETVAWQIGLLCNRFFFLPQEREDPLQQSTTSMSLSRWWLSRFQDIVVISSFRSFVSGAQIHLTLAVNDAICSLFFFFNEERAFLLYFLLTSFISPFYCVVKFKFPQSNEIIHSLYRPQHLYQVISF